NEEECVVAGEELTMGEGPRGIGATHGGALAAHAVAGQTDFPSDVARGVVDIGTVDGLAGVRRRPIGLDPTVPLDEAGPWGRIERVPRGETGNTSSVGDSRCKDHCKRRESTNRHSVHEQLLVVMNGVRWASHGSSSDTARMTALRPSSRNRSTRS